MKILKFIISLFLVLIAVSCNGSDNMETAEATDSAMNPEISNVSDVSTSGMGLNTFNLYGEIHNILLDAAAREYRQSEYEEKEDALLRIQQKAIQSLPIADGNKLSLYELLPQFKSFYNIETMSAYLGDSIDANHDLAQTLTNMYEEGQIAENEYYILYALFRSLKSHLDGHSTGEGLEYELNDILAEWTLLYGDTDFNLIKPHRQLPDFIYGEIPEVEYENIPEGTLSGIVLNIVKHSSEYWTNYNVPEINNAPQRFPLALDGAGAIIGLCGCLTYNLVASEKLSNGKIACYIAVAGIASSTCGLALML